MYLSSLLLGNSVTNMAQVLLVTPNLTIPGGVTEFNRMLISYSNTAIKLFILSGSGRKQPQIIKHLYFIYDVLRFSLIIPFLSAKIIQLNPSLGANAIKRDGILCWIAKIFNKRVYIHWHGWNQVNEYLLEGSNLKFAKRTIFKADHIKFLSPSFENLFVERGYTNKTSVGNTFIDNDLLDGFKPYNKNKEVVNILFLSTISKTKGIYLAIELFYELVNSYNITLTITGDGPELVKVKKTIDQEASKKITFTGHATGQDKINIYQDADIYLFPSQYEGMPISVLEAMGFGLPVVCSSVGALSDFFENGKMGDILNKDDKRGFKNALEQLICNQSIRESIGIYNHAFVTEHFLARKTVEQIDKDYNDLIFTTS